MWGEPILHPNEEVCAMCKVLPSTEQPTAVLYGVCGGGREEESQEQTTQAILEGKNLTI